MATARHAAGYRETILFTQAYRLVWPHLWPIIQEVAVQHLSAALLVLTSHEDFPFIASQPVCRNLPQVRCVTKLPATLPNLKIAFSMSPDNRLQIPKNFNMV
ncbi:MAG: hypothetical protein Q8M92_06185, partial [Candidatus Subteraquimicrobiales bacterium]|nr:hypothetical protein [Candidatus Subteraquimicrobiales bacterium]